MLPLSDRDAVRVILVAAVIVMVWIVVYKMPRPPRR